MSGKNSAAKTRSTDIGPQLVRILFHYDPDTGILRWRVPRRGKPRGAIAGTAQADGRLTVVFEGVRYYVARLIWLYMKGEWPLGEVDHEDLDKSNNRWRNLRDATRRENEANKPAMTRNKLSIKGVSKVGNKYLVRVAGQTVAKCETLDEAAAVYIDTARQTYGEFARS